MIRHTLTVLLMSQVAVAAACDRVSSDVRTASVASAASRESAGARAGTPPAQAAVHDRDVCALLSAQEVGEIAGVPIERLEKKPNGCEWYANADAQQRQGTATARATLDGLMKQEPKSADDTVKTMENLLKGLGGAAAPGKPLFAATVHWDDGDAAEVMMKGTVAANGGGAMPGGGLEPVPGVGDRAFIGAMGALFYARKGDALVLFGAMGITRDQEIALARRLISKIR